MIIGDIKLNNNVIKYVHASLKEIDVEHKRQYSLKIRV
jgi:hypothetical protein